MARQRAGIAAKPAERVFDLENRFAQYGARPVPPAAISLDEQVAKGEVVVVYDTRDNLFYSKRGEYAGLDADLVGQLLEKPGLVLGPDVAHGPGQSAVYAQTRSVAVMIRHSSTQHIG